MLSNKKTVRAIRRTCSQEEKDKIEKLITELEEANKTDDYADIKQRTESLKQAVMEIGDKVYKVAIHQVQTMKTLSKQIFQPKNKF